MTRSRPRSRLRRSISPLNPFTVCSSAFSSATRFRASMLPLSAATRYTLLEPPRPRQSIRVYVRPFTLSRTCLFLLAWAAVEAPPAAVTVSTTDIFGGGGGAERCGVFWLLGASALRSGDRWRDLGTTGPISMTKGRAGLLISFSIRIEDFLKLARGGASFSLSWADGISGGGILCPISAWLIRGSAAGSSATLASDACMRSAARAESLALTGLPEAAKSRSR